MKKTSAKTVILNVVKTLLLPIIVYVLFAILSGGRFGTAAGMKSILVNACFAVVMAWGTMLILASGMWDFSAGAQFFLSSFIVMEIANRLNFGIIMYILTFLVVSIILRAFVGFVYTICHVKSMVCTLSLTLVFEAICCFVWDGGLTPKTEGAMSFAIAPMCYVVVAVAAIVIVIVWKFTKFSFHVRALGAGEGVARSIGLNPAKIRFQVFLVQGIFLALASLIFLAQKANLSAASCRNLGTGSYVFNALMAVFIGQALERWSGRIIGVAIGTLVMSMLNSGMIAMGINSAWQMTVTGVFMALFIGFSTNQQRFLDYLANKKRGQAANEKWALQQAKPE